MDVVKKRKKTKQYAFAQLVEGNLFTHGSYDYHKIESCTDSKGEVCNAASLSTGTIVRFEDDELVTVWAVAYLVKEE